MKNVKRLAIITILLSLSATAFGADNPKYKQFYLLNGSQASAEEAILASLKGGEAFKCVSVQAQVSKAGTSIGLKNVKKKLE